MEFTRFLTFYQSFDKIVKDIKKKKMSYMRDYGLRAVHLNCLMRMYEFPDGMTVTSLSKATETDKALISRTLRELANDGFVVSEDSGVERTYNKKYYLTPKSESILSEIDKDLGQYLALAKQNITEEQMQLFYCTLSSLVKNISLIANDEGDE